MSRGNDSHRLGAAHLDLAKISAVGCSHDIHKLVGSRICSAWGETER